MCVPVRGRGRLPRRGGSGTWQRTRVEFDLHRRNARRESARIVSAVFHVDSAVFRSPVVSYDRRHKCQSRKIPRARAIDPRRSRELPSWHVTCNYVVKLRAPPYNVTRIGDAEVHRKFGQLRRGSLAKFIGSRDESTAAARDISGPHRPLRPWRLRSLFLRTRLSRDTAGDR